MEIIRVFLLSVSKLKQLDTLFYIRLNKDSRDEQEGNFV
jgi:hypothetical protein